MTTNIEQLPVIPEEISVPTVSQTSSSQVPSPQVPSPQVPSPLVPDSQVPSHQVPSPQVPSHQVPSSLVPSSLVPSPQVTDSLVPDSLVPDSLVPDSLVPELQAKLYRDITDVLYDKIILNTGLLVLINDLHIKGFAGSDIPSLILSIINVYNSYTTTNKSQSLTNEDIQTLLERVYNYLVEKYNLVEVSQRPAMFSLFDTSIKLCLLSPNIKKDVTRCMGFFSCK